MRHHHYRTGQYFFDVSAPNSQLGLMHETNIAPRCGSSSPPQDVNGSIELCSSASFCATPCIINSGRFNGGSGDLVYDLQGHCYNRRVFPWKRPVDSPTTACERYAHSLLVHIIVHSLTSSLFRNNLLCVRNFIARLTTKSFAAYYSEI